MHVRSPGLGDLGRHGGVASGIVRGPGRPPRAARAEPASASAARAGPTSASPTVSPPGRLLPPRPRLPVPSDRYRDGFRDPACCGSGRCCSPGSGCKPHRGPGRRAAAAASGAALTEAAALAWARRRASRRNPRQAAQSRQ